ncbi:MAG: hypothetical protein KY461_01975 [Actinobacteria bacterium]|nr:hypothetical protein [Actinomycetota bacterium]
MTSLAIRTSYVLVGERPMLVLDARSGDRERPLSADDEVLWSFLDYGLRLLPGFYGVNLTDDTRLSLVRESGRLVLQAVGGHVSVAEPIDDLPLAWLESVEDQGGAILVVGRAIGAADHATGKAVADAVDVAAKAGRVLGAVVDVRVLPLG